MKRLTHEEVKNYIESFGYELLSEYKGSNIKITVRCEKHHEPYEVKWGNFKSGKRCPHCKGETLSNHFKTSQEKVLKTIQENELELINGLSDFKNYKSEITVKCKHGHTYTTTYGVIKQGYGCPHCYGNAKLNLEFIKKELYEVGYELIDDVYVNATTKLKMRCEHGHEFEMSWNKFKSGRRCPICLESKGEERIRLFFERNNIDYIPQYRFKDCKDKYTLPFDFYIPSLNILIEYDGEGHYKDIYGNFEDRVKKDLIKTNYCLEHNIKLIRIPYWEYDNIEVILNNLGE
jgi:Zn finger protein HypA/HybF involved in hydrogenase expression